MTEPFWASGDGALRLCHGDCLDVMRGMEAGSIDAVVTDPPYGLGFMGKQWDHGVPGEHFWREAMRVAKPGAHLLAFGGTRTFHRLAVAIEDAGWEIRDTIMWVYGSGFPKSLDVSKAIDKAAGAVREIVGPPTPGGSGNGNAYGKITRQPATAAATEWSGWGTALKPAWEPIIVARKPLEGTVAANVLKFGTGAINVDGCRVPHASDADLQESARKNQHSRYANPESNANSYGGGFGPRADYDAPAGRWPANLCHDGSEEVVALFPEMNSHHEAGAPKRISGKVFESNTKVSNFLNGTLPVEGCVGFDYGDTGSAARFFYCAKACKADRDDGCDSLDPQRTTFSAGTGLKNNGDGSPRNQEPSNRNTHPTVKPTDLMRWLVRLVTRPGGLVVDPFCGSGSTGRGCAMEGFRFVGIERDLESCEIARDRIISAGQQLVLPI